MYFPRVNVGPELKVSDVSGTTTFNYSGGSPAAILLNGISAGTNFINRVGRKIVTESIQLKLSLNGFTTLSKDIRVLVVYDKQTNQAAPALSDVMFVTGTVADPLIHKNYDNLQRFTILMDELHSTSPNGTTNLKVERFIKCKLPTRYDGNGALITDITSGGLYLFVWDGNSGGTNLSSLRYAVRVLFSDS